MDKLGVGNRSKFKAAMKTAHDSFNKETFTWKRLVSGLSRFGEDKETGKYNSIDLLGLFDYNYFRKWPTVFTQPAGEIDRQTVVVLLNREYLSGLGYLTVEGRFDYNPAEDRFVYRGIVYKAASDTLISQNGDDPLLFDILLKREDLKTGEEPYHASFP